VEQVPRVPGVGAILRGFNAGIAFSGVHDSSVGWYTVATPAVSYTFSPHCSADASLSIYPYRLVENQNPLTAFSQRLTPALGDVSDTLVGLHATFNPRLLRNMTPHPSPSPPATAPMASGPARSPTTSPTTWSAISSRPAFSWISAPAIHRSSSIAW
jgi:hypothetical protein